MSDSIKPTILVTGATGRVGSSVVDQLINQGAIVRVATRDPATVEARAGVTAVHLDLSNPSTVEHAVAGVDAVYLMWPFFQAGEQARQQAGPIVEVLARHAKRVVYLSSQAAEEQTDSFWAVIEQAVERHIEEWSVLRPTGFAVNAQQWMDQIRRGDVVRWPFGQMARPLIHERDIAAVAAAVLLRDGHHGRRYVITGPERITQQHQVGAIGDAIGRPVRWEELDPAQAEDELGIPQQMLDAWEGFITDPEPVTHDVHTITGRPALSFASWAQEHATEFATDQPPA